jgi:hypothetical protein
MSQQITETQEKEMLDELLEKYDIDIKNGQLVVKEKPQKMRIVLKKGMTLGDLTKQLGQKKKQDAYAGLQIMQVHEQNKKETGARLE